MKDDENGSTLLLVISAVLIATILATALLSISVRSTTQTSASFATSTALMNARSGLQALYREMYANWAKLAPTGPYNTVQSEQSSLLHATNQLLSNTQQWISTQTTGAPFTLTVVLDPRSASYPAGTTAPIPMRAFFDVTVTGESGKVTKTLTDTFSVSNMLPSFQYPVYATQYLFLTGAPEIDGSAYVEDKAYMDINPFSPFTATNQQTTGTSGSKPGRGNHKGGYWPPGQNGNPSPGHNKHGRSPAQGSAPNALTSYLQFAGQSFIWTPEPANDVPLVPPSIRAGTIQSQAISTLNSFTMWNDQVVNRQPYPYDPTLDYGDATAVYDASPIQASTLPNFLSGTQSAPPSGSVPLTPSFVTSIVARANNTVLQEAQQVNNQPGRGQQNWLPPAGGYVTAQNGLVVPANQPVVTGPLYIDGDLTVPADATLNATQPLFIHGNLIVEGAINASTPVYVSGDALILNQSSAAAGSRLALFAAGDIYCYALNPNGQFPATSAVTLNAYFASGRNVYVDGMYANLKLIGGVVGTTVILNSTVGQTLQVVKTNTTWGPMPVLQATDPTDTSRRIVVTSDPSYLSNPLPGLPTLSDLGLPFAMDPLQQPVLQ